MKDWQALVALVIVMLFAIVMANIQSLP